ncbi:MAG: hypothetical protein ABW252_06065 [Polyangiales bacterium]
MHRGLARCRWLLMCAVSACGQVGIDLLAPGPGGPGPGDRGDGGPSGDAGQEDAGSILVPNVPVVPADAAARDAAGPADAGVPTDAATPADAGADAGTFACAGQRLLGLCWYLGAVDQSCDQACAARGGFDTRTASHVGTSSQGGSLAACMQILAALGRTGPVEEGMRSDDFGLGCHFWPNGDMWWLTRPSFRPSAASPAGTGVRIACGCLR